MDCLPLRALVCCVTTGVLVLAGCRAPAPGDDPLAGLDVPAVPREFRAVWVATVANIDWPSEPGLPVEQQQAELIEILDRAAELNLNAIIFQVRPAADALYASEIEPWSPYLTGEMGRAPEPFYDPLAFAVAEAHARGLELHAWFNPYRAYHPSGSFDLSEDHIAKTQPAVVADYGPYKWMIPGDPAVQQRSLDVMLDVATRYDVDGVHIDDYFFPYTVNDDAGNPVPFPDDAQYEAYRASGGTLGRADWRRKSVDDFIERFYEALKDEAEPVEFGISPFGIWKPGHPEQIRGFNQYEGLYADARKWLREGWVDYWMPQLYWEIAFPDQSFIALLRWWVEQNDEDRHIWPGLALYKTNPESERGFDRREIESQIRWTRIIDGADGHVHFSMKSLMNNAHGVAERLKQGVYAAEALVPASPWLGDEPPGAPRATVAAVDGEAVEVEADPQSLAGARLWVVQVKAGDAWVNDIIPAGTTTARVALPGGGGGDDAAAEPAPVSAVVVFAVNETGIESAKRLLELP